jgi:hypothetical protein
MKEQIPVQDLRESIIMAFNLGVWMKQQKGDKGNVSVAAKELRDLIYWNMYQQYGDGYPEEFINSNVQYFLEIALLGYILPGVSFSDEELKSRLIALIEAKAEGKAPQQTIQQYPAATTFCY